MYNELLGPGPNRPNHGAEIFGLCTRGTVVIQYVSIAFVCLRLRAFGGVAVCLLVDACSTFGREPYRGRASETRLELEYLQRKPKEFMSPKRVPFDPYVVFVRFIYPSVYSMESYIN